MLSYILEKAELKDKYLLNQKIAKNQTNFCKIIYKIICLT